MKLKLLGILFLCLGLAACSGSPYYIYSRGPASCISACAKSPFNGDLREPVQCIFLLPSCATAGVLTFAVDTILVPVIFYQQIGAGDELEAIDEEDESESEDK